MKNKSNVPTEIPFPVKQKGATKLYMVSMFLKLMGSKIKLWEDAEIVLADLPVNPDEAKKILPMWMFLKKPYMATFFIANYRKNAFTVPYRETAILLHVRTPFGSGLHCPWMLVDDDTALIYGREALGYPKKLADIQFKYDKKKATASVNRRGTKIVSVTASKSGKEKDPAPVLGIKTYNIGGMGQYMSFNPIWYFRPREIIHESYSAEATLDFQHSDYDPVKRLLANYKNPVPARIARLDIMGARLMLPVGMTGLRVFINSHNLRFR